MIVVDDDLLAGYHPAIRTFSTIAGCHLKYDPALNVYADFLRNQKVLAKDYILRLFEKHDIVVLCERDHRDITQYDLILSVIGDERFVQNVGNVFTEIGVSTLNPELNEFLHTDGLAPDSVDGCLMRFQRDCSWGPLWDKQSYSYFLRGVYRINCGLSVELKINVYPSDLPFDWNGADSARVATMRAMLSDRDSIMADQIIAQFERIDRSAAGRKKALVIMNYRHAFNRHVEIPSGPVVHNTGGFLAARYGDRVANVYVNFVRICIGSTDPNPVLAAIHDGKWDAAFKAIGMDNAGFDFQGSPFGASSFDLFPYSMEPLRYQDIFTGFVYYLPLDSLRIVTGIPGIVDSVFLPELLRREKLCRMAEGADLSTLPTEDELRSSYNTVQESKEDNLDSLNAQIDKWLK